MAKIIGYTLIIIGIALMLFLAYSWRVEKNRFRSPVAEDSEVKVIYITPTE